MFFDLGTALACSQKYCLQLTKYAICSFECYSFTANGIVLLEVEKRVYLSLTFLCVDSLNIEFILG